MKSFLRSMDGPTIVCIALIALASAASLNAQDAVPDEAAVARTDPDSEVAGDGSATCADPAPQTVTLAKMTPVYLSIDATLGSKTSTSGDVFPITVVEPVMLGEEEAIPVGTAGMGEVVHAKKAGGSGSAGELILTATHIDINGQQVKLRSMKLGLSGKDQTGLAIASSVVPGLGFLIKGKNIEVAEGSLAGAKLAQDTQILLGANNDSAPGECKEGT